MREANIDPDQHLSDEDRQILAQAEYLDSLNQQIAMERINNPMILGNGMQQQPGIDDIEGMMGEGEEEEEMEGQQMNGQVEGIPEQEEMYEDDGQMHQNDEEPQPPQYGVDPN